MIWVGYEVLAGCKYNMAMLIFEGGRGKMYGKRKQRVLRCVRSPPGLKQFDPEPTDCLRWKATNASSRHQCLSDLVGDQTNVYLLIRRLFGRMLEYIGTLVINILASSLTAI